MQADVAVDLQERTNLKNQPIREEHLTQYTEDSHTPEGEPYGISQSRAVAQKSVSAHNLKDLYDKAEKWVEEIDEHMAESDRTVKSLPTTSKAGPQQRNSAQNDKRSTYTASSQGTGRGNSRTRKLKDVK